MLGVRAVNFVWREGCSSMSSERGRTLNETFSRNLRLVYELRREMDQINLSEFSSELRIGHTTLQTILSRRCNLRLDTVELIAESLGVSPLQLLSEQYPETDLTRGVLLLELTGVCGSLPPERRRRIALLLCRLMEELADEEPEGISG